MLHILKSNSIDLRVVKTFRTTVNNSAFSIKTCFLLMIKPEHCIIKT
jgi:hypothetical protein